MASSGDFTGDETPRPTQTAGTNCDLLPPIIPFQHPDQPVRDGKPAAFDDDTRLQLVNDRWASLPEAIKQAIFDTVFEQA